MKSKKNFRGFTLVEVIIAISILALIFSVAYKGVSQIARSKVILDDEREVIQVANTLMSRLSRELQMSIASVKLSEPDYQGHYFRGLSESVSGGNSGDKIIFMANEAGQYVPDGQSHSGIVQLSYFVSKDPDAPRNQKVKTFLLVRDEVPNLSDKEKAFERRMTFPITNKLLSLDIQFYDDKKQSWEEEWDETQTIPAMVRVKVKLLSRRGKEMVFATGIPIKAGVQSK